MKKQIKRFVLSVLVLTMVFSCIPATTYAKEQFKWSKSLVLKGKMYYSKYYEREGDYSFAIFCDNRTEVTVKNFNGTVGAYTWPTSNKLYKGEEWDDWAKYCGTVDVGTELADQKKNHTHTIELSRGWNWVTIHSCTDTKFKAGQTIKCKITAKDANIILLASGKRPENIYQVMCSKKKYHSFIKWWMPQYYSLEYTDVFDDGLSDLDADCNTAAITLRHLGYSDLSKKELAAKIKKSVEKIYRQSNKNSKKFVSYQEAFVKYIDSISDLEERLIEKYGEDEYVDYMEDLYYSLNWYKEKVKNLQ